MEKSTDTTSLTATTSSSTSSSSSGSGSEVSAKANNCSNSSTTTTTAPSDDVNQLHKKIQQQSSIVTKSTSTKNQVNNLLGCGPPTSSSATTTAASTTSSSFFLDRGAGSSSSVGNNLKSSATTTTNNDNNISNSNNKMSLNNTTTTTLLGHQSSNKTNLTNNAGIAAAAVAVASTLSKSSTSASSSSSCNNTTSPSFSQMAPINLNISTTTGGNFSVSVDPQITVENLKKIIAKKLKVAKDRICLLHREKELQDGLLKENNLMDGSKIILIPNVETGLLAQRPENTVMQALESLNDSQVNDFLSGKTPLNLSMRLGDHMMLIQLQLSTVNPVNGVAHNGANCSSSSSRQRSSHHHHHHHRSSRTSTIATQTSAGGGSGGSSSSTAANHSHHHHHHHHHHHGTTTTAVASNASTTSTVVPPPTATGVVAQQHNKNATAVSKLELDTSCQTSRCISSDNTPSRAATAVNTKGSTSPSSTIPATTSIVAAASTKNSDFNSFIGTRDYESLKKIVKSIAKAQVNTLQPTRLQQQQQQQQQQQTNTTAQTPPSATVANGTNTTTSVPSVPPVVVSTFHNSNEAVLLEQSPIKSLSNLVSSPIKTTAIKNIPNISNSNNTIINTSNNNSSNSNSSSSTTNNAAIETHGTPSTMCQDPIAAKLTSCLCTRLNGGLNTMNATMSHASSKQCIETACNSSQQQQQQLYQQHQQLQMLPHTTRTSTSSIMTSTPNCKASLAPAAIINTVNRSTISSPPSTSSRPSFSLHKTAHNPIARKHRHHHHHHHHHHHYHHPTAVEELNPVANNPKIIFNTSTPNKTVSNDSGFNSGDDSSLNNSSVAKIPSSTFPPALVRTLGTSSSSSSTSTSSASPNPTGTTTTSSITTTTPIELDDSGIVSDSRTLAEASRNLTQTLRKLSKEVFTNKIDFSASEETTPRKSGSGAVIESMKNHGKGIYSGTFSGTLNPALQDRYGRPKRDISTVIHILNDLLSATPQYHRGARISFEAPSTSAAAAASVAAASGSTGAIHLNSRSKHLSSKHHQSSHPCVKCIKTHNSSSTTGNFKSALAANAAAAGTSSASAQSSSSSTICTFGECNGHYVNSKSQTNKVYPCCQQETTTTVHQSLSSNNTAGATLTTNGQHHHHHASSAASTSTASSHHHHHHHQMADERKVCQCRYRIHAETGEKERDYTCPKCAAELDNIKTKSKLDQLRLVMQQRKQKREARKLKGAPYGARVVGTTTTATASGVSDNTAATLTASNSSIATPISVAASSTTPSEVSPNHLVEEVDTAA